MACCARAFRHSSASRCSRWRRSGVLSHSVERRRSLTSMRSCPVLHAGRLRSRMRVRGQSARYRPAPAGVLLDFEHGFPDSGNHRRALSLSGATGSGVPCSDRGRSLRGRRCRMAADGDRRARLRAVRAVVTSTLKRAASPWHQQQRDDIDDPISGLIAGPAVSL